MRSPGLLSSLRSRGYSSALLRSCGSPRSKSHSRCSSLVSKGSCGVPSLGSTLCPLYTAHIPRILKRGCSAEEARSPPSPPARQTSPGLLAGLARRHLAIPPGEAGGMPHCGGNACPPTRTGLRRSGGSCSEEDHSEPKKTHSLRDRDCWRWSRGLRRRAKR